MTNPNLDIQFTYTSINSYYTAKLKALSKKAHKLPHTVFTNLKDFAHHLLTVKNSMKIDVPHRFDWSTTVTEDLWVFREYAFCSTMLFLRNHIHATNRSIPETLNTHKNTFTVIGSQFLTSDIDVTVQGPYSAVLISILEDIFELLTNKYDLPMLSMDIQFYGDFRILSKLYVNTALFSVEQRYAMLKYAYISYFRSLNQVKKDYTLTPLARRLGYIYLVKMKGQRTLKSILEEAYAEWTQVAPYGHLDRELFYKELQKAETESLVLAEGAKDAKDDGYLADDLFFTLARGNIHRKDSYILPSTSVHIVELEQVQDDTGSCAIEKRWFTTHACIGLDEFAYMASAIEQCGYLEHYHPGSVQCNKKGVKYFGRMVRALLHADLLDTTFLPIYKNLNMYRKLEDGVCHYNIHTLLRKVQKALGIVMNKTRRRLSL
jgi:hypothetical protein